MCGLHVATRRRERLWWGEDDKERFPTAGVFSQCLPLPEPFPAADIFPCGRKRLCQWGGSEDGGGTVWVCRELCRVRTLGVQASLYSAGLSRASSSTLLFIPVLVGCAASMVHKGGPSPQDYLCNSSFFLSHYRVAQSMWVTFVRFSTQSLGGARILPCLLNEKYSSACEHGNCSSGSHWCPSHPVS